MGLVATITFFSFPLRTSASQPPHVADKTDSGGHFVSSGSTALENIIGSLIVDCGLDTSTDQSNYQLCDVKLAIVGYTEHLHTI